MTAPGTPEARSRTQLQVWAAAYIGCWLDADYWTIARIAVAIEESGATAGQIAEAFALTAASLLSAAHGHDPASASATVAARLDRDLVAEVRRLAA